MIWVDGYQTSYVLYVENPVRFEKEIKATIEHGYANHLAKKCLLQLTGMETSHTPTCCYTPCRFT